MQILSYLFCFVLIFLPFISNTLFGIYEPFIISILLLSAVVLILLKKVDFKIKTSIINLSLLTFVFLNIFLIFFSYYKSHSIYEVIFYIQILLIFFCLQKFSNYNLLIFTSKAFVILTTLFGIFSLSKFIELGLTANVSLAGIVGSGSVYGGFLILPFFFNIYLLIVEKAKWQKRFWYFCLSIISTSLFLTFSYDTWLTLVLTCLISLLLFSKQINEHSLRRIFIKIGKPVGFSILLSFVVFCSVWYMARETILSRDESKTREVALYENENPKENFFESRLMHFSQDISVITNTPFFGIGSGLYKEALRVNSLVPTDKITSYNWFLRIMIENGPIVAVVFVSFIFVFLLGMIGLIRKIKINYFLPIIIFTGLFASSIHGLISPSWASNQVILIWFIFAGSLYGYLSNLESKTDNFRNFSNLFRYVLLVLGIIITIISTQLLRADLAKIKGDIFFVNKDNDSALNSYFQSAIFNPKEPEIWYKLWMVYYSMNKFELAKNNIKKAIELYGENGLYWGALAKTNISLDEMGEYRENMIKAIKFYPMIDSEYYLR